MDFGLALGVASLTLAVAGIAVPFAIRWLDAYRTRVYTWKRVLQTVHALRLRMRENSFTPDVILAYPKGGLIVADLLAMEFDPIVPICSVFTSRVANTPTRTAVLSVEMLNTDFLAGKKVLVVDDVIQSGTTLLQLYGLLTSTYNISHHDVKVAVLGIPRDYVHLITPDYVGFRYAGRPLVLPWGDVGPD